MNSWHNEDMAKLIVIKGCDGCPFLNEDVDYGCVCNLFIKLNPNDPRGAFEDGIGGVNENVRFEKNPATHNDPVTPDWCPLMAESILVSLKE